MCVCLHSSSKKEYAKLGPALQEILNRFQLVEMMSADMRQEEDNKKTASAVYELVQQDEYLAEKMILPEELHTMGFLECTRANFDYLDSVESVPQANFVGFVISQDTHWGS